MSGFTSYSVDNDRKFRRALNEATRKIGDLTIPLTLISKDFYRSERAIFQLSGPGRYPDLSTRPLRTWWEQDEKLKKLWEGGYKEYKTAKWGEAYPILKASGRLMKSLLDPTNSEAINHIVNKDSLIIGSAVPYFKYHQSDAPRKRLPQRKALFIGPESTKWAVGDTVGRLDRWMKILRGFVQEASGLPARRK